MEVVLQAGGQKLLGREEVGLRKIYKENSRDALMLSLAKPDSITKTFLANKFAQ